MVLPSRPLVLKVYTCFIIYSSSYSPPTSFLQLSYLINREDFPTSCIQVLDEHRDEVWFCKFSNNGKRLASGSKDGSLIIWDVCADTYKLTVNKIYDEHQISVAYIAWSPNDRYVIVCGTEESTELWIWDVDERVLKKRISNSHDDSLTSAAWLPDSQSFVTGGLKGHFYYCDIDGNIRETWEGVRVRCLQTLPDGVVLAADTLKRIRSYNFKDINDANLYVKIVVFWPFGVFFSMLINKMRNQIKESKRTTASWRSRSTGPTHTF